MAHLAAGRMGAQSVRAWDSLGNGALFTHRIRTFAKLESNCAIRWQTCQGQSLAIPRTQLRCLSTIRSQQPARPTALLRPRHGPAQLQGRRVLQTSPKQSQEAQTAAVATRPKSYRDEMAARKSRSSDPAEHDEEDASEEEMGGFKKSDKAAAASKMDFSARLSKDDTDKKSGGGRKEITRLLMIARPELGPLSLAFVFLLISSGVSMSVPFSIGKILDAVTGQKEMLFGLPMEKFYLTLAAVLVGGAAANFGRVMILRIIGEKVVSKLRSQLFRRTFIQNAEFFDANRVGDLISRLGSDTIIVGKSITQNVSDGLRSLVSAAAGLSMMSYVSLKLVGVIGLAFPPIALGAFFYGRAIRNLSRKIQKNLGTLTKIAEERLGNVRTSQAFAGEVQEVSRYNTQVRKIFNLGRREALISAIFFSSSGLMGNMTLVALLYVGGAMVKSGAMSIGDLSSFLMYAAYAGSSLFGLSSFYSELMKGVGAASRLFELQDREPGISPTKGEPVKTARGPIEFKSVSFSYPTRPAVTIFKDLTFTIPQGANVAIVAPSGAGKSTVASLLLRFYNPTTGTITINGRDITQMNTKQLRRRIGYVGQEPVLFSGTIAENIAYGKPLATRSEIVAAARQANCGFISDFPEGLETFVGARGTQLSGGQKQRIAIARALIKDPDILILDEATSALDAESETLVNQALHRLLQGQNTTISIAHRLSTIQRSDSIICLGSDGRVAQVGSYADLARDKEGAFAKLMEWQMSGGQMPPGSSKKKDVVGDEGLTEEERMERRLVEHDGVEEGVSAEVVGEGAKVRGRKETSGEAVLERVGEGRR